MDTKRALDEITRWMVNWLATGEIEYREDDEAHMVYAGWLDPERMPPIVRELLVDEESLAELNGYLEAERAEEAKADAERAANQ